MDPIKGPLPQLSFYTFARDHMRRDQEREKWEERRERGKVEGGKMREEGRKKEGSRGKRRRARLEGLGFFPFGGFDFFSKSSSSSPDHLLKVVRARIR